MAKRKRPVEGVQRRYPWKLYPTAEQETVLREQAGMRADLWNALLEMCEARYRRGIQRNGRLVSFHCAQCAVLSGDSGKIKLCDEHKLPSDIGMGYWITDMLRECPEWRALSTWTPRRVATALDRAFQAFFRRVREGQGASSGYPRFKSRRKNLAIPHRCLSGCKIIKSERHERSWSVRLKGVPSDIWARGKLPAVVNEWMDADVMYRDGRWEISAAVAIEKRRESWGTELIPTTVNFDLIDGFAEINGEVETPAAFIEIQILDDQKTAMQSDFDRRWPRRSGKRYSDEGWEQRCEAAAEIGRLSSRIKRMRANTLHVWTKQLVERASELTVIRLPVKEVTESPRGDAQEWGAAVEPVSTLNRTALSFAPGMAAAMLEYKAKEIGIQCFTITDEAPNAAVGKTMVAAGKTARRVQRKIRRTEDVKGSGDHSSVDQDRGGPARPLG